MKNIQFLLIFALLLFAGCKIDFKELNYKDAPFVSFPSTNVAVFEALSGNTKSVKLSVVRASGDISAPLTVNFTASAKYASGLNLGNAAPNTYTLQGEGGNSSSLVIPANKVSADITLTTVDNPELDGYKEVNITLTSTSDANFSAGFPGPAKNGSSAIVTIFDDEDTSFNLLKFVGPYGASDATFPGNAPAPYETNFSVGGSNIVSNNNFSFYDNYQEKDVKGLKVNLLIDPVSNKVSILAIDYPTGLTSNGVAIPYTISNQASGTGTFDPVTGDITLPYRVRYKNTTTGAFFDTFVAQGIIIFTRN